MTLRLVRAHRNKDSSVSVYGRDEFGKQLFYMENFRPYFYIGEDEELVDSAITDNEWGFQSAFGDAIRRVYTKNPTDVRNLRDRVPRSWEADILYPRRYIIDQKIYHSFSPVRESSGWKLIGNAEPSGIPIVTSYLDIECDSSDSMPDPGEDVVTCISISDGEQIVSLLLDDADYQHTDDTWYVRHFSTEEKLLTFFCDLYYRLLPDVISGWNVEWDCDYLLARCAKLKIPLDFDATNVFDLLTAYRGIYRRRSYRLKDIVVDEGLEKEVEPQVNYAKMWREDRDGLLHRNKRHAQWVAQIDKKLGITDYHWSLKEMSGVEDLSETMKNSVLIDTLLLRRTKGALPTREEHEAEPFEGAYIMQPTAGIYKDVAFYDLSRFYPSVLRSERLDPLILHEFLKSHSLDWNNYKAFADSYTGYTLVIDLVDELIAKRNEIQKKGDHNLLMSVKGLTNSLWGVLGYPGFRLFTNEIPARVTEIARAIIKLLISKVAELGYSVIYSDTDSSAVVVPKDKAKELEVQLNDYLKTIGDYSIKTEHMCDAILFVGAKKRYCFLEKGELHTVGFETRRTDSSAFTRDIQSNVMRMILEGRKDDIIPYLKDRVEGVKKASLDDICITKSLSKDPEEYAGNVQSYIKGIKDSGLKVKKGDFIKMVPAKNYSQEMAVWVDETDLDKKVIVNYEKIIDSQIRAKVEDLIALIDIPWGSVVGREQGKLF